MRHQLVGYLLGALDDAEHQQLEEQLARDSQLKYEASLLRKCVEPLGHDGGHLTPPLGLAQRTCEAVQCHRVAVARAVGSSPESAVAGSSRRWSMADLAVAAGIILAAGLLLLPALNHSRASARIMACQNKLTQIGRALHEFSRNHDGHIPSIPQSGPLSVAGVYAPKLIKDGLVPDAEIFVCASSELAAGPAAPEIPSWDRLVELKESGSDQFERILPHIGGSYGYNLGYMENGVYRTTLLHENARPTYALMADSPCPRRGFAQSSNHGGDGQNVLFEDLHVRYLTGCGVPGCEDKDFFRNEDGQIAAGTQENDAVIGHCSAGPCPQKTAGSPD